MTPEEAMKYAHTIAEAARSDEAARLTEVRAKQKDHAAAIDQHSLFPIHPPVAEDLSAPMYLHERELENALRAATLLASGRNPFGDMAIDRITLAESVELLRALSIVVCTLIDSKRSHAESQAGTRAAPAESSADRSWVIPEAPSLESGGMLEEYLDKVERTALLHALNEARNNKTAAARLLGITFRAPRYRLERLRIE